MASSTDLPPTGPYTPPVKQYYGSTSTTATGPGSPQLATQEIRVTYDDSRYRDSFWGIAFILHLLAVALIFFVALYSEERVPLTPIDDHNNPPQENPLKQIRTSDAVIQTGILSAGSMVLSFGLLQFIKSYPKAFIWAALIFDMASFAGMAFYFGMNGGLGATLLFGFGVLFWLWFAFVIIPFIPFSALLLRTVVDSVILQYPTTQILAFGAVLVQLAWFIFWGCTLALVHQRFSPNTANYLTVFLLFSLYWTFQVIRNIAHTTVAGVVATWYFLSGNPTWAMAEKPVMASFTRATTTSFGSICLGSLLVAIIQTLRTILRSGRGESRSFFSALADSLLYILEVLAQYFNQYVFIYIAMYGRPYFQAAQATARLFVDNALVAVVNDSITSKIILMASAFAAIAAGLGSYLLTLVFKSLASPDIQIAVVVIGALVGWMITAIVFSVVESSVSSLLVCYVEEPAVLQRQQPFLFEQLSTTFGSQFALAGRYA